MAKVKMDADLSNAYTMTGALSALHGELNTPYHLSAVTRAAFALLEEKFLDSTHAVAMGNVDRYHHVYEWEHVGHPGFQLFRTKLQGRGGQRSVTWEWRASKTTVPTMTDVNGEPRFESDGRFDPTKLKRIHVFVWKAPVMEYGVEVTVAPKLGRYIVFPNPDGVGDRRDYRGPRPYTFSKSPVRSVPGREVQGNFTQWFIGWWGSQVAQDILDGQFNPERDKAFQRSFHARLAGSGLFKAKSKNFSIAANSEGAAKGRRIARIIAGDMEHNYIKMAARRRRRSEV